jgi:hypothetical protein
MTKKEMVDAVKFTIGLQDINAYDETGKIELELYNGTIDLLSRTKVVVRCVNLNVSAGVAQYKLDHQILALVEVEDGMTKAGRADTRVPSFTLIRADILRVQPTPTASDSLQVWAVLRPTKMTAGAAGDAQSVGDEAYGAIPDEYQDAIVTYALWKCADYADDATAQQGERYRTLYEGQDGRGGRLAQIRVSVNKRGTARAPGRRVRLRGVASRSNWVG